MSKTFSELVKQTHEMAAKFEAVEQKKWGVEGAMIELTKQVGELAREVMMKEQYYFKSREEDTTYHGTTEQIADELFDVWFCLMRVAKYYNIDLEEIVDKTTTRVNEEFTDRKIT